MNVDYSFVDNINTVFGPDDSAASNAANPSDIGGHSHLLNVGWKIVPALAASAYHYELDLDGIAVTATAPLGTLSSRTTGLRLEGVRGGWSYAAEYARQGTNWTAIRGSWTAATCWPSWAGRSTASR